MNRNTFLAAALVALLAASSSAPAALIIGDDYNIAGSGTGFALGSGVNSGINPPTTTRLTGSAAAGLRYIKAFGAKADNAHYITNSTKLGISRIATDSSTLALSSGSGPFDFAPALNALAATPGLPAVYELTISIANGRPDGQRCSFAISSTSGTAGTWDFGIQIYRATTTDPSYTLQKRISAGASGGAALNSIITNVGTYGSEVAFFIRVTDAGPETLDFNSRVQVSTNGGANWIYDSDDDADLTSTGFRFPSTSRYIFWDIAGGAGPVLYDDFSLNWMSGPTTAVRTWTGGGGDDNWSTGANWGGTAPSNGDPLVFNGTTRPVNTNDIADLTVPYVTFNNGGFTLYGNTLTNNSSVTNLAGTNAFGAELAWGTGAAKAWRIAGGSEVSLNGLTTVEVGGDHTLSGGGTLRLKGIWNSGVANNVTPVLIINEGKHIVDGGAYTSRGGYRIGSLASGSGAELNLLNNASFTLTVSGANLRVGDSANPLTSRLLIQNSTLTLTRGNLAIPYAANATGEVAQVGGLVTGGTINFSQNGAGTGTYGITNGVLEAMEIKKTSAAGIARIHFDNATLRPAAGASNAFFAGLNLAEIEAGGLALDASSDIVIGQILSGNGPLVKSNSASVTLTGANTYSGNTLIEAGKLALSTMQTNSTSVQVANSAELGVVVSAPGTTLSVPSIHFAGASFGQLSFDLGDFSNPTAPLLRVPNLSVSGPVTINITNGLQLTTGQFVLVDYDGAIGGGNQFTLGSLPDGVSATLVANGTSLDLNITAVPALRWTGSVNGEWDNVTQNWVRKQNGQLATYSDGVPVEFLDGASNSVVNIGGFFTPAIVTVSNSAQSYLWANGAITVPLLEKSGAGSLTRVDTTDDSIGDLITTLELNQGSYVVSNLFDANFASVLTDPGTPAGTLVKAGDNILTLTSSNGTYDGAIEIRQGTLKLGTAGALGTTNGSTTIAAGATLDLNDIIAPHEPIIVSGSGVGGQGAIIDSTAPNAVAHNLTDVNMTGDTTFGAPSGRWDIRVRAGSGPGPGLRGNGFNLTKVGPGFVSIACQRSLGAATPYWEMNLGDVLISEGTLALAESLSLGNPAKALTVNPGAALQLFDLGITNPIVRNITMTDARLNGGGANSDTNVINGTISITGSLAVRPDQCVLIINGPITGSGLLNLSANEPGRLYLNGANTYPGDTTVTNGTLGGTGSLAGNLVMLGGTNSPGFGLGTFTVNGSATLAGTTLMEVNRNQSPNSDRLVVAGSLNFGGILQVVLGTGAAAPQFGDVYQLFNKAGVGSFTSISLPPLSGGLAWNTADLAVNGTISVTTGGAPPSITSVYASGNTLVFSGTGGTEGNPYVVVSATNVALPNSGWIPVMTNVFGPGGTFSVTNVIDPAKPLNFYRIHVP